MASTAPRTGDMLRNMNQISIDGAASLIGVASATIRNWVKAGHLTPAKISPLTLWKHDVIDLKSAIRSGLVPRLRARANKSKSETSDIPREYASQPQLIGVVRGILDAFRVAKCDLSTAMYLASLRVLELTGEVQRNRGAEIADLTSFHSWRRSVTKNEISDWRDSIPNLRSDSSNEKFYVSFDCVPEDDFLGLLYQSFNLEGDKSNGGSYFTPSQVVRDSLSQQGRVGSFLDPCCGTGKYLLYAAKYLGLSPAEIYGFDIDRIAVRIARLNVLLAFPSYDKTPAIECRNTLTEVATGDLLCSTNRLISSIDFIATNPPWGAYKNAAIAPHFVPGINSTEAFALFLAKSLTLLRAGGSLSFLLPDSFLRIRTHREIRGLILRETQVARIVKLGRQFSGVYTSVIRLDVVKKLPARDWEIGIEEDGKCDKVKQIRFQDNEHNAFDIDITASEDSIIRKLYEIKHTTLAGNADWALGIVTGNNGLHLHQSKGPGMEAIIRGGEVSKFVLQEPRSFIWFEPNSFQQVARESMFRAPEKLVYKFITKSLAFAYDDKQRLTLNSANILIPRLPEHSVKVVLGFLNSAVFDYIFRKKYSTHKVLRGDIEKLPFPFLSELQSNEIESAVSAIMSGTKTSEELDDIVFACFGLNEGEMSIIKEATRVQ